MKDRGRDPGQPRRRPRRAHGRAVFEAILEATSDLISRERPAGMTHIAERAGVSVGSLYGYFEDRLTVLAEVLRNKEAWAEGEGARLADEVADLPLDEVVETLVSAALTDAHKNRSLRRALNATVPQSWAEAARRRKAAVFRRLIAAHLGSRLGLDRSEAEDRAFVIFHAIDGVVRAALQESPERLRDEALHRRLVDVVTVAMRGPEAP